MIATKRKNKSAYTKIFKPFPDSCMVFLKLLHNTDGIKYYAGSISKFNWMTMEFFQNLFLLQQMKPIHWFAFLYCLRIGQ